MNNAVKKKRRRNKNFFWFETLYLELLEGCTLSLLVLPLHQIHALCYNIFVIPSTNSVFISLPLELGFSLDLLWPSEWGRSGPVASLSLQRPWLVGLSKLYRCHEKHWVGGPDGPTRGHVMKESGVLFIWLTGKRSTDNLEGGCEWPASE